MNTHDPKAVPADDSGLHPARHDGGEQKTQDEPPVRRGSQIEQAEMRTNEANIRVKAEAVELAGFHRFATALRDLADGYDRDAEAESKRSPFED